MGALIVKFLIELLEKQPLYTGFEKGSNQRSRNDLRALPKKKKK